jgi:hypothetical protein
MKINHNYGYMEYTYLHRKALVHYIEKHSSKLSPVEKAVLLERAKVHDLDKQTLYLTWNKEDASAFHKKTARHHLVKHFRDLSYINKFDILESIFDFECAGLTKPDKPLNAYDTVMKYYPECADVYMPVLEKLGMVSSYKAYDVNDLVWLKSIEVNDEVILDEVRDYLCNNIENIYTILGVDCMPKKTYNELMSK